MPFYRRTARKHLTIQHRRGGHKLDNGHRILVTDSNSVWAISGSLLWDGAASSLLISNAAEVRASQTTIGSVSNSIRVSNGAVWRNEILRIANGGASNSLTVAGGSVFATNLIVGFASTACDNMLELDAGSVIVTNATGNAVLEIRRGKLILKGGTLLAERFVMTDSCAQFGRTGGTLIYGSAVLTSNLDADGDGMANGWEQAYDLDPLNAADASADPDGDGFTNLQEFQAGTDPNSTASAFRILSVVPTNDNVLVTWATAGGRTNVVQSALDLTGSYSNISPNIVLSGSGAVTTNYVDAGAATNATPRFYRIQLVP
jgi:hypothetical protein